LLKPQELHTGVSFYSLDNGKTWIDSISAGVDLGENRGHKKINFYSDIAVFTVSRDYNLSISTSTDDTISAEDGGSVSVTLDLKNVTGDITTKIYNSNKQDVTNKFKVTKDSNKYTIAGIVGTTTAGTYTAVFTYKDAVAEKTFKVTSKAPSNVLVEKITIAGKTEVVAGGYLVLDATVTPKDATNKVLTWSSSDIKVATVDQEGIVKAVNEGTATITAEATDGSKVKGTINIKVIGKKVEQISNDVKDDTNEDPEKSPETGLTSITTALLITMLLSVIAYVVFKKKNLFKRV
ncbi:MAG: Ig-like domain-containing protein, partial [Bacilli bacterium]|nr:Ig-like domain-containing protein [Bacilli bacterium]